MKAVVVTGGVGGAKFVSGLYASGAASDLVAIVNTGDDFRHFGLHISPDVDTLLYTLSGKANLEQGWGREDETWSFMAALKSIGAPDWFLLGDGDLALHVVRSERLARGESLSQITADFARRWDVGATILPMSDDPVATSLDTDEGELPFQRYFVERRCAPVVRRIRFDGAERATAAPGVVGAILGADAIFIAPSNPFLSVDPILAIEAIATALRETRAPVVAVSPLVGGKAVKGPTGKLMAELGLPAHNDSIAEHYRDFIDAMLHDASDAPPSQIPARATATLMLDDSDRRRVAIDAVALARGLGKS